MMITKRAKAAIEAVKSKHRHWTFEVKGTFCTSGISDFLGKLKDENGLVVLTIKEDEDFNQLSRLMITSKYMRSVNDMKGLAEYVWDRNLVILNEDKEKNREEKESWNKKKIIPLDIKMKN